MAAISLVTAGRVRIVESFIQMTLPAGEAITAGQVVRIDVSTGRFVKASGGTAPNARAYGIAVRSVASGQPVTAIRKGVLDGFDLAGAYDAPAYLGDTAGTVDTAAGTVSVVLGRIIPSTATSLGTAFDKLLMVDL